MRRKLFVSVRRACRALGVCRRRLAYVHRRRGDEGELIKTMLALVRAIEDYLGAPDADIEPSDRIRLEGGLRGLERRVKAGLNPDKPPVKGVYPSQTGFGWTNGVFERLCREYID